MKKILFLLLLHTTAYCEVVSLNSFQDLVSQLKPGTLLVVDIDETLLKPSSYLGSKEWQKKTLSELMAKGLSEEEADAQLVQLWIKAQSEIQHETVEDITPEVIRNAQKKGITVMGLTARSPSLSEGTKKLLKGLGYNVNGILFVEYRDKGVELVKYLNEKGLHPAKVLFVDDIEENAANVEKALAKAGIPHTSYHYQPKIQCRKPLEQITESL